MTAWLVAGGAMLAGAGAVFYLLWRRAVDTSATWQKQALALTSKLTDFTAAANEERKRLKELIHVLETQVDAAQSGEAKLAEKHPDLLAREYGDDVLKRAKARAGADPHAAVPGPAAPAVPERSSDGDL